MITFNVHLSAPLADHLSSYLDQVTQIAGRFLVCPHSQPRVEEEEEQITILGRSLFNSSSFHDGPLGHLLIISHEKGSPTTDMSTFMFGS